MDRVSPATEHTRMASWWRDVPTVLARVTLEARRQHLGQVPGTDGRSCHGVGERVEGEDEDAGSHQRRREVFTARHSWRDGMVSDY